MISKKIMLDEPALLSVGRTCFPKRIFVLKTEVNYSHKDVRLNNIINMLLELGQGNYDARLRRSDLNDELDTIINWVNMLAERLKVANGTGQKFYEGSESTGNLGNCFKMIEADVMRVRRIAEYITQNMNRPLSLTEVAYEVGISVSKLKKDFKIVYGTTFSDFLWTIRMLQAKKFLLELDWPVKKIAYEVCYKNFSGFTAAFKKKFNCTPREMRQCYLKKGTL